VPVTEINDKDANAPFVTVKVPKQTDSQDAGHPIIFEVRIQHNKSHSLMSVRI